MGEDAAALTAFPRHDNHKGVSWLDDGEIYHRRPTLNRLIAVDAQGSVTTRES